jgi:uncharacterized protein YjbJ (UPF0337 family)
LGTNSSATNTGGNLGASANTDFDSEVALNDDMLTDPLQDPVTGATGGLDSEVPVSTTSAFNDVTDTATTDTGLSSTGADFDNAPVFTGTTSSEATPIGTGSSASTDVAASLPSPGEVKEKAGQVVGQAKEQVGQAVGQAKETAGQAVEQVKEQAGQVIGQVKEQAGHAFEQSKDQIFSQLNDRKGAAAEGLAGVVGALHQAAAPFRDANVPYVAEYAESFASQIDRFAGYLRENDVQELAHDVERLARQNPMAFVGAAFVVGLGVARFLKSSVSGASRGYDYDRERSHALVPTNGNVTGSGRAGQFDQVDDTYGAKPRTASNYVPGIGVISEHAPNV